MRKGHIFRLRSKDLGRSPGAPLSLRLYPDPILRCACKAVERFDSSLSDLADEMLALMRAHEGIGLAAPQVGIERRLFVAELQERRLCLVNPVITAYGARDRMTEECLSLPDVHMNISRPDHVVLTAYNRQGHRHRYRADSLLARVIQHEIDHLNGILICDHRAPGPTEDSPDNSKVVQG